MNFPKEKVKEVSINGGLLTVFLDDGRIISAPLSWYPSLESADEDERMNWQPCGAGTGVYWPDLDYDLSIAGIIQGAKERPSVAHYVAQSRKKKRGKRALAIH